MYSRGCLYEMPVQSSSVFFRGRLPRPGRRRSRPGRRPELRASHSRARPKPDEPWTSTFTCLARATQAPAVASPRPLPKAGFSSISPRKLRLRKRAKTVDEGYVLALAEQVEKSGLDKAVILAQDAVYDRRGKPDWDKTQFYVPNDYLLQVMARYPGADDSLRLDQSSREPMPSPNWSAARPKGPGC